MQNFTGEKSFQKIAFGQIMVNVERKINKRWFNTLNQRTRAGGFIDEAGNVGDACHLELKVALCS